MTIVNTTIAENRGTPGPSNGGLSGSAATTLLNSIVALNFPVDCGGQPTSLGNNIFGSSGCTSPKPTDLIGDPRLGEFVDDESPGGGHYPLLPESPAIDAGNQQACPATDQLDQPRFGTCDIGAVEFHPEVTVLSVSVDLKPGDRHNNVQPNSNARISVAILSTASFDASTVDQTSVRFGPSQIPPDRPGHIKDVNHDKLRDLVVQFRVRGSGIQCGDTSLLITGQTLEGTPFQASDSITTVGCKTKKPKKKT